jgi:TonB family protein
MSEEELRKPIYAQGFRLLDDFGGYRRLVIVVEAGLDEEGYVTDPRVVRAEPVQRFNKKVLEAVSTWRYCPEYAALLGGERFEIPFDMKAKEIRRPMPGY